MTDEEDEMTKDESSDILRPPASETRRSQTPQGEIVIGI